MKQKGESRRTDLFAAFVGTVVVATSQTIIVAFSFMLMIGVAHSSWISSIPPISFGVSLIFAVLVTAILTSYRVMIDYKGVVYELFNRKE